MVTNTEIIKKYWKFVNDRDWVKFKTLLHEDIVYELPQTRERIRGQVPFCDFNRNYPGDWTLSIVHLVADDTKAISQISFKINNEEQIGISFFKFKDGLISHIEEYWPNPYDPPIRESNSIENY